MSVAVNQPGVDYHVVLAQNALQQCLDMPELQAELICALIKQTSRHTGQKLGAGVQVNKRLGKQTRVSWLALSCAFYIYLFFVDLIFYLYTQKKYFELEKTLSKFIVLSIVVGV